MAPVTSGYRAVVVVLGILGVLIVLMVNMDLLWTAVAAGAGGGPITSRLANLLWAVAPRGTSPRRHRLLQVTGVLITLLTIAAWIGGLLLGWFLIFNTVHGAVVDARTSAPADLWARFYFTGFTVFTLGTGDYVPRGPLWQVATVIASGTGLVLVTLAITYVLSVTSSVTQRRQLAAQISTLGTSPVDVLRRAWNGKSFAGLESALQTLPSGLTDLAQRHLAFPVLHYFHSPERSTATAPSVAVLDELLTVLQHGVAPPHRLPELTVLQVRDAVSELLARATGLNEARPGHPPRHEPPTPPLDAVQRLGIPVVDEQEWRARLDDLAARRGRMGEFLATDGWQWDNVWPASDRR